MAMEHRFRLALPDDSSTIFNLVNSAYSVEIGVSGLAFRKENRYLAEEEVIRDIGQDSTSSLYICCCCCCNDDTASAALAASADSIVGVVRCVVRDDDPTAVNFGPFAVRPDFQGRGVGKELISQVEKWALSKSCDKFLIEVVNHRTDLWGGEGSGFYGRQGFVKVTETPCDAAHNLDESKVTRESKFIVLQRMLRKKS